MPGTPSTSPRFGLPRYDNATDAADFASQVNAISDLIDSKVAAAVEAPPIGSQMPYVGTGDPNANWLLADGRTLAQVEYPALYARISHRYNGGAAPPVDGLGRATFRLPDKRGNTSVGADTMGTARGSAGRLTASNALGQRAGAERVTLATGQLPVHGHAVSQGTHAHGVSQSAHSHGVSDPGHGHNMRLRGVDGSEWNPRGGSGAAYTAYGDGVMTADTGISVNGANANVSVNGANANVTVGNSGSGQAHDNLQPSEVDNWIVRVL